MLSSTGRSLMWDAGADGNASGEGVMALILKKLSDALADGDAGDPREGEAVHRDSSATSRRQTFGKFYMSGLSKQ